MAIIDTSITGSFNEDRDENIFIGLDLPIRKSDGVNGYFAATSTTLAAVRNNIRNFVNTHKGERFLQPTIGLNLRRFLFEQFTIDTEDAIKREIQDGLETWLPFVQTKKITITKDEDHNSMSVNITFNITHAPNMVESVDVDITGE